MDKHDFYYDLPERLIAQTPLKQRDASRLMCLDRTTGAVQHLHFIDLPSQLRAGDCLILNNSRVLPARLYGQRADTGSGIEFLLLTQKALDCWEILCRPGKKAKVGTVFVFGDGLLRAEITEVLDTGNRICRFSYDKSQGDNLYSILERIGEMPLPHYIKEKLADGERYQTVYSKPLGSVAAPTAGLHFTPALLKQIENMGVSVGFVTLHVGLGTFRPVKADDITQHHMHSEHYEVPAETAALVNQTRARGGRVICVGTTSCRTLESAAQPDGSLSACEGWTDIFIYPGYRFKIMDGLVTNFHLPESTLVMLVSAFAGREHVLAAYEEAIREEYRFFSFGDAMLIL